MFWRSILSYVLRTTIPDQITLQHRNQLYRHLKALTQQLCHMKCDSIGNETSDVGGWRKMPAKKAMANI